MYGCKVQVGLTAEDGRVRKKNRVGRAPVFGTIAVLTPVVLAGAVAAAPARIASPDDVKSLA